MAVKRPRGRRTRGAPAAGASAVVALAVVLAGGAAGAHPEPAPAGTNRYVTATVAGGRVEIADAWWEGALAAAEERRRLDADGDGRISESELARGRDDARAPALAITLDGSAAPATVAAAIDLGGDAAVGTTPVAIERRITLALGRPASGGTRHALTVDLVRDPPRVVDTEVSVDLEPGWVLAGAPGAGRALFRGPRRSTLEARSVTFAFASAPAPVAIAPRPRAGTWVALLALLAGAALAGAHRLKQRPAGGRLVELMTHAAFPAVVSALLAYARPRLLPDAPQALRAAAAAVAALLALWTAARNEPTGTVGYGHDDGAAVMRLVPSVEMMSLAVMGAFLPVRIAAVGAAAFGVALAARARAVPRAARVACAVAATIAVAAAVCLAARGV